MEVRIKDKAVEMERETDCLVGFPLYIQLLKRETTY